MLLSNSLKEQESDNEVASWIYIWYFRKKLQTAGYKYIPELSCIFTYQLNASVQLGIVDVIIWLCYSFRTVDCSFKASGHSCACFWCYVTQNLVLCKIRLDLGQLHIATGETWQIIWHEQQIMTHTIVD